jgi:CBS domain-containing membrane protein
MRAGSSRWTDALPSLPGSSLRHAAIAALGAFGGIALTGYLTARLLGADGQTPVLMAPLAASSVILFVLPSSPIGRPWSIVVGHVVSAVVGITVARYVPNLLIASGLSVALSIVAMTLTRSLHPPGGSTALIAVLGGPAITAAGYRYAWLPVGLNALLLVTFGYAYHRWLSGHPYPSGAAHPPVASPVDDESVDVRAEDIDAAVTRYGEALDLDRADVEPLVRAVLRAAAQRRHRVPPTH